MLRALGSVSGESLVSGLEAGPTTVINLHSHPESAKQVRWY